MGSRSKPKASLFPDKLPIRILTQSMSHQTKAKAIQRIVATQINSSFSPPLHLHKALKSFDPTMSIRLKSPNVKSILDVPIRTNSPSPADKEQVWPMTQLCIIFTKYHGEDKLKHLSYWPDLTSSTNPPRFPRERKIVGKL